MIAAFFEFLTFLQPPAAGGGGAAPASDGGGLLGCGMMPLLFIAMLAMMYFTQIRPEQKRREQVEDMQKGLRKGQKVRTTSGILGEIISINERDVVLGIADKVRITILRENIRGPEVEPAPSDKTETKKDDATSGDAKKA